MLGGMFSDTSQSGDASPQSKAYGERVIAANAALDCCENRSFPIVIGRGEKDAKLGGMFSDTSQSGDASPQSKAYGEKKKSAETAALLEALSITSSS
jgi:hypothetical protein